MCSKAFFCTAFTFAILMGFSTESLGQEAIAPYTPPPHVPIKSKDKIIKKVKKLKKGKKVTLKCKQRGRFTRVRHFKVIHKINVDNYKVESRSDRESGTLSVINSRKVRLNMYRWTGKSCSIVRGPIGMGYMGYINRKWTISNPERVTPKSTKYNYEKLLTSKNLCGRRATAKNYKTCKLVFH